ncbi:hypothetical protein QR680_004991 [Steinernema hermaphroditum]|uniref:Endonuclease/exonuclease/phosphatase domain-containing protein n=1 Tax=Steinernema hermaphroditum TaxID=289476 RepID=A0AA39HQF9_9BILA|nr:hypothetical protein QR680_004991 [Steinernema hermaphroditum]
MNAAQPQPQSKPKDFVFLPRNRVFQAGPPGHYAVRYYSSPGNVLRNFAIRRTNFHKEHKRKNEDECLDSLSYYSACFRSARFREELEALSADIFCLQEVQKEHFDVFFQPLLKELGFDGRYEQKTQGMRDGCALFFRRSVFQMLDYRRVDMFFSEDSTLDKPNVGQLLRLRHIHTKKELCVANTHLVFNKKFGARKFVQMALLLAHLHDFVQKGRPAEYLLCGDLNIEAFSDIYRFVVEAKLDLVKCVAVLMSGQGETVKTTPSPPELSIPKKAALKQDCSLAKKDEKIEYEGTEWRHQMHFASAYNHVRPDGTHDLSTFHSQEGLNPDFVFYSVASTRLHNNVLQVQEAGLRLLRRLDLPDISEANAVFGPWPHEFTPSDHVPLLVDFALV